MKINITIEATPEEVRETVCLPDLTGIQNLLMNRLTEKVKDGSMDVGSIMEMLNPKANVWGKLFMDAAMRNFEIMTMGGRKSESTEKQGPDQAV